MPAILGTVFGVFVVFKLLRWRSENSALKFYHIFISYRVATDSDLAEDLCKRLQGVELEEGMYVKCYFDRQDISDGVNWKNSFLTGLEHSCLFVPLVCPSNCVNASLVVYVVFIYLLSFMRVFLSTVCLWVISHFARLFPCELFK